MGGERRERNGAGALVVGNGDHVARASAALAEAGYDVRVVSHDAYVPSDLDGRIFAIATDLATVDAVLTDARTAGIFCAPIGETLDLDALKSAARAVEKIDSYASVALDGNDRSEVLRELQRLPLSSLATLNAASAENEIEAARVRLRERDDVTELLAATCATRASALALTQTRGVAARLAQAGIATRLLTLTTTGDRVQDRPIAAIGSENVWIKELETALADQRADYAVHSCKDLPARLAPGFRIAAFPAREDPRDALCSERYASLDDLPAGAIVGTSSLRRRSQLAAIRGDLEYRDIRGNIDTRLRKLRDGQFDAIVLAMAGLNRLKTGATYTTPFSVDTLVPAVAQGALAIEMREAPTALSERIASALDDEPTALCVQAERAALAALRAGCNAPLGIYATLHDEEMTIRAVYIDPDSHAVSRAVEHHAVSAVAHAVQAGQAIAHAVERERAS